MKNVGDVVNARGDAAGGGVGVTGLVVGAGVGTGVGSGVGCDKKKTNDLGGVLSTSSFPSQIIKYLPQLWDLV